MSVLLYLFFLMIQLIGSAPRVSNFTSYRSVLTVIVRCGAWLIAVLGVDVEGGAVVTGACCDAVGTAVDEAVAAASCCCWFFGEGAG